MSVKKVHVFVFVYFLVYILVEVGALNLLVVRYVGTSHIFNCKMVWLVFTFSFAMFYFGYLLPRLFKHYFPEKQKEDKNANDTF